MEGRSIPGSGGTSESSWGQLPDARSLGAATSDGGELSREGGRPGDQRPRPVDDDALSGTRFAFGGRRPQSVPLPRATYRPSGRPLPGIGTVALGRVARLAPYGA